MAILGNNGAGKSTLLKCFAHLLRPQSGQVLVDGEDLLSMSFSQAARTVALVSQNVPASRLTVYDMVLLGRKPYMKWDFSDQDRALTEEALSLLGLEKLALRDVYKRQVVGGLVDCPVIAVPTSVGYGASFGGLSALLSMLNSCASGCSVVNIDNGFGAGYLASRINQMEGLEEH